MKQVALRLRDGRVDVLNVPTPSIRSNARHTCPWPRAEQNFEAGSVDAMSGRAPERVEILDGVPHTAEEYEHQARYKWAAGLVRGNILDVACGSGYGSEILAPTGSVVGIDQAKEAIELALVRAAGEFLVASVPPIPFDDNSFDAVVTFETVEHIDDDAGFVREIRRVLRPGGLLLLSTPNKAISSPSGMPKNPWHTREYTLEDIRELIEAAAFQDVNVFAQRYLPRSGLQRWVSKAAWRARKLGSPGGVISRLIYGSPEVAPWQRDAQPVNWVLLCR